MVEIETGIRENTVGALEQFVEIANVDPLVAVLVLVGMIVIGVSIVGFGVLTLGAIGATIKRGLSGSEEPIRQV